MLPSVYVSVFKFLIIVTSCFVKPNLILIHRYCVQIEWIFSVHFFRWLFVSKEYVAMRVFCVCVIDAREGVHVLHGI